jgi:hypothetical protein
LRFVLRDARCFLEDRATLLGLRRQDLVDLALRHDRVAGPADAGIHKKLVDVLQAAGLAVEEILALPVAMNAAHDLDLVKFAAELLLAVREQQRYFTHLRRLACVRALENDVLHLTAAQRLRTLLAKHPADRVRDIGFPASIRAYDRRDARFETEG